MLDIPVLKDSFLKFVIYYGKGSFHHKANILRRKLINTHSSYLVGASFLLAQNSGIVHK